MWKIGGIIAVAYLGSGAICDILNRKIPSGYLMAGTVLAVLYLAFGEQTEWYLWVPGAVTGLTFLAFSKLSGEGIGYGDSWMILNLGLFLGIVRLLVLLGIAFAGAAVASGLGIAMKKWNRKTRIPFYPFLLVGYLGAMLW